MEANLALDDVLLSAPLVSTVNIIIIFHLTVRIKPTYNNDFSTLEKGIKKKNKNKIV